MYKIAKRVGASVVLALQLLVLGVAISFLVDSSNAPLSAVLFIIGGILIVFFSPGLFSSSSSGALHTPVVVYRLVNTLSRNRRRVQGGSDDTLAVFFSSRNLVLEGLCCGG